MVSMGFFGRFRGFPAFAALLAGLLASASGWAQTAHFHHIQLNVSNPTTTAGYFVQHFGALPIATQGFDSALRTERSYLFLRKNPPKPVNPAKILRVFWHIGWGCASIHDCYERLVQGGVNVHTPLTPLGPKFHYAYIESPDGALIEVNTHREDRFGHIHLYSHDPWAAGDWYQKHFGMLRTERKWFDFKNEALDIHWKVASLHLDNLNLILFPPPEEFEGKLRGSDDGPIARIGFSFDDFDAAVARFREEGVEIHPGRDGQPFRSVTVEGPEGVMLEIVENASFPAGR